MENASGSIPMDFLRELDYWLLEANSVMSPAESRAGMVGLGSPSWMSEAMGMPSPMPPPMPQTQTTHPPTFTGEAQPRMPVIPVPGATPVTTAFSQPQAPPPAPLPPVAPPAAPQAPIVVPKPPVSASSSPSTTPHRRPAASAAPAPSSSSSGPPPRKKGKANKSTSQRQKEELAFLRDTITQLEKELDKLKQQNRDEKQRRDQERRDQSGKSQTDGKTSTELVTHPSENENETGPSDVSLWERIAKRQQEEKTKAEVENAKLREMVEGQIRLVKSFERLLCKRRIWEQLQEDSWKQHKADDRIEAEVFEELLRDVDARYAQVDAVLEKHSLGGVDPSVDVGDNANIKYSDTDGMYLEFKEKKFVPFGYRTMDEVVWRSFKEGKIKLADSNLTIVKETPDTYFTKSTLPPSLHNGASSNGKECTGGLILTVVKRYHEHERVVYVWVSNVEMDYPPERSGPAVHITQKGCSVSSPATLPDVSVGSVCRSYTSLVPTLKSSAREDGQLLQGQHREVGLLAEMIFASYQQSRQMINQSLENLLLDEMMAKGGVAAPSAPDMP